MVVLGSVLTVLLSVLFIGVAALMILVILVQKPKGGGLGGAFGGGGGGGDTQSMFGARAGDVLTWITVGFFVVFLLLGIGLVFAARTDAETATTGARVPAEQRPLDAAGEAPAAGDDAEAGDATPDDGAAGPAESTPPADAPTDATEPADATPTE
jgi:preprotein translocase subunit SecG